MAKADAIVPLDELDGIAGGPASHAMEQAFVRRDDKVAIAPVIVERTAPDPVLAFVLPQFHAPAADQCQQVSPPIDPFDFQFRDAGHSSLWR
jgi:hypothetical protein